MEYFGTPRFYPATPNAIVILSEAARSLIARAGVKEGALSLAEGICFSSAPSALGLLLLFILRCPRDTLKPMAR